MSIAKTRAAESAAKSRSSRTLSSFWKEQASETRAPKRSTSVCDELLGGKLLGPRGECGDVVVGGGRHRAADGTSAAAFTYN